MLFLFILGPLVLYCCLPKDLRAEIDDWVRLLVGIAVGISAIVWVASLVFQLLFGIPAVDNVSPLGG